MWRFQCKMWGLEDLDEEMILVKGARNCVDSIKNNQGELHADRMYAGFRHVFHEWPERC